jgi:hypothetical protein
MCERGACPSYKSATEGLLHAYRSAFDTAAKQSNLSYIPPMDNQFYQWPRALANTTWAYELPEPGDVADKIKRVFDIVRARATTWCEAQVVFMYSWNEMSEGGGLCPTMGMDTARKPVTGQLDEVAGALRGDKDSIGAALAGKTDDVSSRRRLKADGLFAFAAAMLVTGAPAAIFK